MTNVYWLKQATSDVPSENDWLTASEVLRLEGMRFAKRQNDWRLGRWTAKRAVALCLDLPDSLQALSDIEIRAAASGAPEILLRNKPAVVAVSISHSAGAALCAVAPCSTSLGCDIELIEPRSDAFVTDYFTSEEQQLVAQASAAERSMLLALLWSGKESTLKALHTGLRLDTRCVIVSPADASWHRSKDGKGRPEDPVLISPQLIGSDNWRRLLVRCTGGQVFQGWWQAADHSVQTLVAADPPATPVRLVPNESLLSKV
jgi:4'-phosphopantetheinyl transferase